MINPKIGRENRNTNEKYLFTLAPPSVWGYF
nr:MAG TPA: hypothetical protein [Caudoviricetes sp.]